MNSRDSITRESLTRILVDVSCVEQSVACSPFLVDCCVPAVRGALISRLPAPINRLPAPGNYSPSRSNSFETRE